MHRLPAVPSLPREPARPPFPVVAVAAPLVGAVAIGIITGSPFVLVFAVLSPLIAIATMLDGRRVARRDRALERVRFDRECRAYEGHIARAHDLEREQADAAHPLLPSRVPVDASSPLRLGVGRAPSAVAPDATMLSGDSEPERRLRGLVTMAQEHAGLPVIVSRGPIALRGTGAATESLVRRLQHEPGVTLELLGPERAPRAGAVLVEVPSPTRMVITEPGGQVRVAVPEFVGRRQLASAHAMVASAVAPSPPASVTWAIVRAAALAEKADQHEESRAGVPVGVDGTGVVRLDLEREGPHALVGGTTGSGKSEFLRALALGWAADRPPSELQLLFVDFKGGATFAGLTDLPHAVGLVTDLDPLVAERALLSLRAELRRRERVLAEEGVRDITQRPGLLARLVVLVDEFAALVDAFPELQAPFADLSARGRSLGVHLVLCTQNPAGVVRDAVAANCAMRIAFRLASGSAAAFVGSEGRDLAAAPPGRALVVTADRARVVQIAAVTDDDIATVRRRWADAPDAPSTWVAPLPAVLERPTLDNRAADEGRDQRAPGPSMTDAPARLWFGMLDVPAEQRRLPALWQPDRDGSLAVVGAPRSGRTTALAALALAADVAGLESLVLPGRVPDAWTQLGRLADQPPSRCLLLADDLDHLVAEAGDLAPELLARWAAAVRALRRAEGCAAAAVGPATATRSLLGARFESRLVLRSLDVEDHQLAGAPRGMFDRAAPAGRGWWAERQVQVFASPASAVRPTPCPAPPWSIPDDRDVIVVTRRPIAVLDAVRTAHPDRVVVREVTTLLPVPEPPAGAVVLAPRVFVADPETWQTAWSVFSTLRRSAVLVLAHGEASDARSLLGLRGTPPPLDTSGGEVWVSEPGEVLERRRWLMLTAG